MDSLIVCALAFRPGIGYNVLIQDTALDWTEGMP